MSIDEELTEIIADLNKVRTDTINSTLLTEDDRCEVLTIVNTNLVYANRTLQQFLSTVGVH